VTGDHLNVETGNARLQVGVPGDLRLHEFGEPLVLDFEDEQPMDSVAVSI
jgi:hypothetical protein